MLDKHTRQCLSSIVNLSVGVITVSIARYRSATTTFRVGWLEDSISSTLLAYLEPGGVDGLRRPVAVIRRDQLGHW
jgi:hypothetical protein